MRSLFSIVVLVAAFAVVMLIAKKQMQAIAPRVVPASAGASAPPPTERDMSGNTSGNTPREVGRQVEDLMRQGERRVSEPAS